MTTVVIAIPEPRASALAAELELEGVRVTAVVALAALLPLPPGIDAVVIPGDRAALTTAVVTACDRRAVRIITLGDHDERIVARYGLAAPLAADAHGWEVAEAIAVDAPRTLERGDHDPRRIITVWGPHGSPGRSTVAIQLAVELARAGRRTALVDADTVAPSLALLLGLGDDEPGIAAACRRAELGALDASELDRLASGVRTSAGTLDLFAGVNRPSRWPELSASRLRDALRSCRSWTDDTVVDVAAALDADDEATFDLAGPRRHAATAAALTEADLVVAVVAADPLGISRFLRDHVELRRLVGATPVRIVVNQVRPGPLGIDARGQVRRTLERFAGLTDVTFLPFEQRVADAAVLHARPLSDVAPRSTLVAAIRRLAVDLAPATAGSSRGSSRDARRPRRARAAPAASRRGGDREPAS